MPKKTLLVILSFKLSDVITKGELISRYFNPKNTFDEVHILLTNSDTPDPRRVQESVGRANLFLHNYPFRPLQSLGLTSISLSAWTQAAIPLVQTINPDVVRCHGEGLNTLLALRIKRALGIPYLISLHSDPDGKPRKKTFDLVALWLGPKKNAALREAEYVLPVYQSAANYARLRGVKKIRVIYNVLNIAFLKLKNDYALHKPPKLLCVGRLIEFKNPRYIIEALSSLHDVELDIVGDGPLRVQLEALAENMGLRDQVKFIPALKNDDLLSILAEYDVFLAHTEYSELPKTVMEAALAGLPVVINRREPAEVPEVAASPFLRVENSGEGYFQAIQALIENDAERARIGREARAYAQANWAPEVSERQYAEIYHEVLAAREKPQ